MKKNFLSHFLISIIFVWTLSFPAEARSATPCPTVFANLSQTDRLAWDQVPKSLRKLLIANGVILATTEVLRLMSGGAADVPAFFWNTGLDTVMTGVTHTIATRPLPEIVPRLFVEALQGKRGFVGRASANTFLSWALTMIVWHTAAQTNGATISPGESIGVLQLCAGFYFAVQWTKTQIFIKIPRRLDRREIERMKEMMGDSFAEITRIAAEKGVEFSLSREIVDERLMGALQTAVLRMPWEERITEASLSPRVEKIRGASSENHKQHLRLQLIRAALRLAQARPDLRFALEQELSLGAPLTPNESFQLLQSLERQIRRKSWFTTGAAIVDPIVGGLAGGIFLRAHTAGALAD